MLNMIIITNLVSKSCEESDWISSANIAHLILFLLIMAPAGQRPILDVCGINPSIAKQYNLQHDSSCISCGLTEHKNLPSQGEVYNRE